MFRKAFLIKCENGIKPRVNECERLHNFLYGNEGDDNSCYAVCIKTMHHSIYWPLWASRCEITVSRSGQLHMEDCPVFNNICYNKASLRARAHIPAFGLMSLDQNIEEHFIPSLRNILWSEFCRTTDDNAILMFEFIMYYIYILIQLFQYLIFILILKIV